jgi:hypothetical protein
VYCRKSKFYNVTSLILEEYSLIKNCLLLLKPNSLTYDFVEVSGHNLASS